MRRPVLVLDEEAYKDKIQELLDSKAKLSKKRSPAKEGDEVLISFHGYNEQGAPIRELWNDSLSVILGRGRMFQEVEEALSGKKKGDRVTVSIALPSDFYILPGENIRLEIEVLAVTGRIEPELSDAFAAELEIEGIRTVKQLETFTKAFVLEHQRYEIEDGLRREVMRKVIEASEFDICENEIDPEVMSSAGDLSKRLLYEGISLDDYLKREEKTYEGLLEDFRRKTVYKLKYLCVIDRIAEKEGIAVTGREVRKEVTAEAKNFGLTYDVYVAGRPGGNEKLKKDILKKKIVEFVISKIDYTDNS